MSRGIADKNLMKRELKARLQEVVEELMKLIGIS